MQLVVDSAGAIRCVYDEAIDLAALGRLSVRRGSHVEPDAAGYWTADLAPVGGPALGPYKRHSEALEAERAWLEEFWLCGSVSDQAQPQVSKQYVPAEQLDSQFRFHQERSVDGCAIPHIHGTKAPDPRG